MGYSPWGRKESEMTEHTHLYARTRLRGPGASVLTCKPLMSHYKYKVSVTLSWM